MNSFILFIISIISLTIIIPYILVKKEEKRIQDVIKTFKEGSDLICFNEFASLVVNNKIWLLSEDEKFIYNFFSAQEIKINIKNLEKISEL